MRRKMFGLCVLLLCFSVVFSAQAEYYSVGTSRSGVSLTTTSTKDSGVASASGNTVKGRTRIYYREVQLDGSIKTVPKADTKVAETTAKTSVSFGVMTILEGERSFGWVNSISIGEVGWGW